MPLPSPEHCCQIVPLLIARDGTKTVVILADGRTLGVFNIAWGEDLGDDYEHLTINISPDIEGTTVDLFFTDEVVRLVDPVTSAVLWMTDGDPVTR